MRLLAVAVVLISAFVRAETLLEQARAQHKALQFKEAARTLESLAKTPGLSRAEAVEAWFLEGLVSAALSNPTAAKEAFVRALLLDPARALAGKVSPRVSTPFLEAKAVVASRGPLDVKVPTPLREGPTWTLKWVPAGELSPWVETIVLTVVEDQVTRELPFPIGQPTTLEGRAREVELTWKALDARGWVVSASTEPLVLARWAPAMLPRVAEFAPTIPPVVSTPFPLAPGIIGLGAGGVSVTVGTVLLTLGDFLPAVVLLGAGGALLTAGGVLLGVGVSSRQHLALLPTTSGAVLSWSGVWP